MKKLLIMAMAITSAAAAETTQESACYDSYKEMRKQLDASVAALFRRGKQCEKYSNDVFFVTHSDMLEWAETPISDEERKCVSGLQMYQFAR